MLFTLRHMQAFFALSQRCHHVGIHTRRGVMAPSLARFSRNDGLCLAIDTDTGELRACPRPLTSRESKVMSGKSRADAVISSVIYGLTKG